MNLDDTVLWMRKSTTYAMKLFDEVVIGGAGEMLMAPVVQPSVPYKPDFGDNDGAPNAHDGAQKPTVIRKKDDAIQSQLREGAFLGTLHLPIEYGGFYKSRSEEIFRLKDRNERRMEQMKQFIQDFLNFSVEAKDPKYALSPEQIKLYEKADDEFCGLAHIDKYLEGVKKKDFSKPPVKKAAEPIVVLQFPRFGSDVMKNVPKTQKLTNGIQFDEAGKAFWCENSVGALRDDLEKGMIFERDRIFWTQVRETVMRTLPPRIYCIEDEAKKKSKTKQYREKIWNLFQLILEDTKKICISMIDLEEKKAESVDKGKSALQVLLGQGAQVNSINKDGFSPLMLAARNGHLETLNALLENPDIDIYLKNEHGSNAMHYAAMYAHKECVQALREKDSTIRKTQDIKTPKMYKDVNTLDQTPYDLAKAEEDDLKMHKETIWKQKVVKESQFKLVPEVKDQKKGNDLELAFPGIIYKGVFKIENPEVIKPPSKDFKPAREGQPNAWRISKIPDPACKRDDFDEKDFLNRWKNTYKKCKP